VPGELSQAFCNSLAAQPVFAKMSHTYFRKYAEWIGSARRPETRTHRVQKALAWILSSQRVLG
jgi:uncharacterized protein YdeI (YjbR/CyaY-like superfamily)